ncbi:transposase [Flavisolibacter tropicus]|uniref:transposase n=1 Tax=Flavisolibacter tropicus TaxID=1492898 RepID=UPI0011E05D24|nr:transposase [Flavisolibacter tropicus]
MDALRFRAKQGQVKVCASVLMPNHIHLIWRISKGQKREVVQRDFLKFTARAILEYLNKANPALYAKLQVHAADRALQVWKRDSMSIDLYSGKFLKQKTDYIHANPCQPKWNLVAHPVDYYYSSAAYYENGSDPFQLLTHFSDI